ncbi:type I restriction modification DNA specificity domain protein [Lachnospiraceae bacterium oral taxon 082 str. F0431]|nr:type I restriction modification DNA specificity domain protein [Lachnospiraceae bacterium oral taxon 082 str. F0431]
MEKKNKKKYRPLSDFINEYSDRNNENNYRPVSIGKYGIRSRESIYSKELADNYSKNKLIYKNTLTVGMGSKQIDIGILTEDSIYSVSPAYHTYKISKIKSKYLDYCIRCRNQDMFNRFVKRGSRQGKSIDLKRWLSYEIPVYDIDVQEEIVDHLNRVSLLIELRKAQICKYDELIKARFVEMFGDPVSNTYGFVEATLPELGEFGRGVSKHRPRNDPKLLGGIYPLIQTGDVANSELYITSYNSTYSELGLKQSKMWGKGTLCITIAANIAKTAILGIDACFPDSIVGFNANEKTSNIFIHFWFSFFQEILESQAPESAQKNINLKVLSELKVIVPEKDRQDEFVEFINQVNKSKVEVKRALDEAQLLFDSLIQKYFG